MRYIGIDIGSSFIKSALIDVDSFSVIAQHKFPSPARTPLEDNKKFEIPASSLLAIVISLIDNYTKEYKDIAGVIFSTQMHGFVYHVDGMEDVYISWQDMRCLNEMPGQNNSYMGYLKEVFPARNMINCGVYIKPSLGLCNLFTLFKSGNVPANGTLYTLGSYIIFKLTGNHVCHIMNAAPWGLVDLVKHSWNPSILNVIGFNKIRLPELVTNEFEPCGTLISNGQTIRVFPDFGDQQVAILGSIPEKDDVVLNIATASQVSITKDTFIPGDYEVRPYFEGRYINTISNLPAGRNLDVLIHFIQELISLVAEVDVTAAQIWEKMRKDFSFDSKGIKMNTGFYETPKNLDGGCISGIKADNLSLHNIFPAAFEDMAKTYSENIRILCGSAGYHRLVCAGGVSWRIPELLKMIGLVTSHTCVLSAIPDEALSGLFRIALVCAGTCKDLQETKELTLKLKEV